MTRAAINVNCQKFTTFLKPQKGDEKIQDRYWQSQTFKIKPHWFKNTFLVRKNFYVPF